MKDPEQMSKHELVQTIYKLAEVNQELLEVLEFCKKKREFEGTPKMVINQMSDALDVIAK